MDGDSTDLFLRFVNFHRGGRILAFKRNLYTTPPYFFGLMNGNREAAIDMDTHGIQRSDAQQEQSDSSAEKNPVVVDNTTIRSRPGSANRAKTALERVKHTFWTFGKFVGPGFMISVAYSELIPNNLDGRSHSTASPSG